MTGSCTRILAGLALIVAASNAAAQSAPRDMDYRWLTWFGDTEYVMPAPQARALKPRNLLESVLSRAFVSVESDYRLPVSADATGYFRRPDPEFGKPAALRRPQQARLSFSVRF